MGLLMLSSPPKFNADYLFGPSRPYVSPRPDWGHRTCTPPVPPPRAGRPVRADTTSGEDGINNNKSHEEGVLILKFLVPDAEHLRALRATRVPAFLNGAPAGYNLSTRCGNLKIIDVNGEKVESLSCCGVLKGEPHRHDDCIAYLSAKHARTNLVAKLAPMRQAPTRSSR